MQSKSRNSCRKIRQINILPLILLLLLLAGGGWGIWKWLAPVDERDVIADRLDAICEIAAKDGKEGIAVTASKSNALAKTAWEYINVDLAEFRFSDSLSREEVVKLFSFARQQINTLRVSFYDMKITLQNGHDAVARGTIIIEVTGIEGIFDEAGDVMTRWRKSQEDGQWYVTDVSIRPVLSHNF